MKNKHQSLQRWLFILAALTFLIGLVTSLIIFRQSDIRLYPTMIAGAYNQAKHQLIVPGEKDVNLKRSGAYGIYYIHKLRDPNYIELEIPPKIDCRLISKKTEEVIKAVPDYVKTNRYRLSDQSTGVLIMSITVDEPGIYTFSCNSRNELNGEKIQVALGPNYFWEFLRVAWKMAGSLFGGVSILCGSLLLTFLFLITAVLIKLLQQKKPDNQYHDLSNIQKGG